MCVLQHEPTLAVARTSQQHPDNEQGSDRGQESGDSESTSNAEHRPRDKQHHLSCHENLVSRVQFDEAAGTRTSCIVALAVGVLLALAYMGSGIYICITHNDKLAVTVPLSTTTTETLSLATNVVITLCIDGIMFIHSVSLRWALYHEGRLEYNTNIRLFTFARHSPPNKWYSNLAVAFFLVLSYGASSVIFLTDSYSEIASPPSRDTDGHFIMGEPTARPYYISGAAMVALGTGIAGQAAIAVWCLLHDPKAIPTRSSNPINSTLAAIHNGNIQRAAGRRMLSVHQRHQWSNQEVYAAGQQENMLKAQRMVRFFLVLLWVFALLAVAWFVAIFAMAVTIGTTRARGISASLDGDEIEVSCWASIRFHWEPKQTLSCDLNVMPLALSPNDDTHVPVVSSFSMPVQALLCILFACSVQAGQTMGLHCAELLVNLSRDETAWRRAYIGKKHNGPGARLSVEPLQSAVSNWESIVPFVAKAVLHWAIGQGLLASFGIADNARGLMISEVEEHQLYFSMVYPRLFVYAILAVSLAAFATFLAIRRPGGGQPATFGDLQTLANLIDDWRTDEHSRIWWGDKTRLLKVDGEVDGLRYTRTSSNKTNLEPLVTGGRYAGLEQECLGECGERI